MRRLIVLLLLLAAVAAGWWLRDRWMRPSTPSTDTRAEAAVWEPLTPQGAARAREAVQQLNRASGPVFVNVRGADLAAYVYEELVRQLPPSAEDIRAAVIDGRLYIKASVMLSDLGGRSVLGPLAALLSDRDTVQFGGRFEIIRPGLAQFLVEEIRVREFPVPGRLISRLIEQTRRGVVPAGVADNGLPIEVPPYIGDVRIAEGRVTLYKNVP